MAGDRITIGNVEIASFSDGFMEYDLCNFFPSVPQENWQPYDDALTSERRVRFPLTSFLVRSDGRNILVDTGMGPRVPDAPEGIWGELLGNLKGGGVTLEEIDTVVLTHLHRDHVGWNLLSDGGKQVPTFPNARYWVSAADLEFFRRPENLAPFPTTRRCVLPLEEMGVLNLMEGEHAISSHLTTMPAPGHTPGHVCIVVSSQGQRALILGDIAHNMVQLHETTWASRADIDPELASATRRSLAERLEREGTLVASGHMPAPGFGRLVRLEGRRYWQAI